LEHGAPPHNKEQFPYQKKSRIKLGICSGLIQNSHRSEADCALRLFLTDRLHRDTLWHEGSLPIRNPSKAGGGFVGDPTINPRQKKCDRPDPPPTTGALLAHSEPRGRPLRLLCRLPSVSSGTPAMGGIKLRPLRETRTAPPPLRPAARTPGGPWGPRTAPHRPTLWPTPTVPGGPTAHILTRPRSNGFPSRNSPSMRQPLSLAAPTPSLWLYCGFPTRVCHPSKIYELPSLIRVTCRFSFGLI